ncbi:hypothetical protein V8E55_003437 [Tylopilus felleus]
MTVRRRGMIYAFSRMTLFLLTESMGIGCRTPVFGAGGERGPSGHTARACKPPKLGARRSLGVSFLPGRFAKHTETARRSILGG